MTEKSEISTVAKGALARWPIVILAAVVVGGAAFAYAWFTIDTDVQEATAAVRVEVVAGLPSPPTVDTIIAGAKSADVQASAAETVGAELGNLEITAFADPNDVRLVRISVQGDDAEEIEAVADAMGELVTARAITVLDPELSHNMQLVEYGKARLAEIEDREARWLAAVGESTDATGQAALEQGLAGYENLKYATGERVLVAQFQHDKLAGVVNVEGEAKAVDVSAREEIIGATLQGTALGAIAGVAVAFLLSLADARRRS